MCAGVMNIYTDAIDDAEYVGVNVTCRMLSCFFMCNDNNNNNNHDENYLSSFYIFDENTLFAMFK